MLATGTFGFTSVSADRGVDISVVSDDEAFVGYQSSDKTVEDGERVKLVNVTNRFSDEISVTDVRVDVTKLRSSRD
ncbi:MAG: hypothetical protein U5K28_04425 [Halobacteriales archaeon]|nr:hypothetical protein [Halobacteriales archaeon]